MRDHSFPGSPVTSLFQRVVGKILLSSALAAGIPLALLLLCSITAAAQVTAPTWVQAFGSSGTGDNIGNSVKVGPDHNLYVTGQFSGTATFGRSTTLTSVGGLDIFVAKYSQSGALLWIAPEGSAQDDTGRRLALDKAGNVYATGTIGGQATFHSATAGGTQITVGSAGQGAIYLAKYTPSGTLLWVQTGVADGGITAGGLAVNAATGTVYITATAVGNASFSSADGTGNFLFCNCYLHMVMAKYSVNGFFKWAETNVSSDINSAGVDVAVDADDNAYVTGWFEATATFFSRNHMNISVSSFSPFEGKDFFDPNFPSDTFLAKYDTNGNAIWVNHIGGYKANPSAVAVGPHGEVTLVGAIGNINNGPLLRETSTIVSSQPPGADFDLGGGVFTNPYNTDEVIATYNSAGELIRALRRRTSDNESANGVAYDSRSNLYVSGVAPVNGQPQLFVQAYSGANLLWEANAANAGPGGPQIVSPALYANSDGSVFVTGGYSGTASFGDITLNGAGTSEVFVSQLEIPPVPSQVDFISADNLTPFQHRDVGSVSGVKTVRLQLTYARALSSIAIAPGFTEFQLGSVSGCVVDGQTVNPVFTACDVQITFSPKYPGLRTAPLIVTDSSGVKSSIGLTGIGLAPQAALTPGIFHTVAGYGQAGFSGDGRSAKQAQINAPFDVATDAAGNIYFSDQQNDRVRKVDSQGNITTVAGIGLANYSGDGSIAISASLSPFGIALDAAGNLYIADSARVRKVDINGIITTFAGTGNPNHPLGDGGPATEAGLQCPNHLTADATGNVYISDACSHLIRKVDTSGIITTVAGTGTAGFGGDGGPAADALLNSPEGITVDAAGNLYIADADNQRIRKVDHATGNITTVAGNGQAGFSGDGGSASNAQLNQPSSVAVDAAGDIYIADASNARIRRVDIRGMIITVAGSGSTTYNGDGISARSANISPQSITLDSTGNLLIADFANNRVRKVDVSQSAVGFTPQAVGSVSKLRRMVVTNTGNEHMSMGTLNVAGDFNLLTGDSSYCSSSPDVGAGLSCALEFTFAPTEVGTRTGSATVTDNSLNVPGSTQTITLNGAAIDSISLSAANLTFASQTVATTSPAQTVTLTNSGGSALTINSIVLTGANASSFAASNNCGSSLAGGASCTMSVTFSPTAVGTLTAALNINDNDPAGSPQTVMLTGTGVPLSVSLSGTSVTFAPQIVGTTSPVQTVILTNTGLSAVTINSIVLTGANASSFATSNDCGSSLAAGASCTMSATFSPTAVGTLTAALNINDNATGSPQIIMLTGTGITPATAILSTSALTFGNQPTNTASALQSVTLTNTGGASLVISKIALTGANPASFVMSNTCGAGVGGGGSCLINVRFDPQTATQLIASITITDSASNSPQTVTLSGTGVPGTGGPIATFSPIALDFTNNISQTATLTNTGGSPLVLNSISVTGPNATSFVYGGGQVPVVCTGSLARGASCMMQITFVPQTTGAYSATLVIADNASDSPQTIALTGTGPFATLFPSTLDFGSQAVGTTSASQTVTITNTGGGRLSVQTITQTGANSTSFTHSSNCGGQGVVENHGESCQIVMSFTPKTTGTLSATITITDNANSPISFTVTGAGVNP